MSEYAVVDSGTTNTRLRLVRGSEVVWSGSRPVGARDTARDGGPSRVLSALRDLLTESAVAPDAIICSGMITSNVGLMEVPHLPAPVTFDELAGNLVKRSFPELGAVPLTFIPGVKTLPSGDDFASGDILRGEEAEIAGLLAELDLTNDCLFLHVGSHHKLVEVSAGGAIRASRTSMTGELLAAIAERTILKSTLLPLADLRLDMEAALAGADAALEHGVGRALFLARVGEQLCGRSQAMMTSYCIGALATLDLGLLQDVNRSATVVVYGQGHFPGVLLQLLERAGFDSLVSVPEALSERCAATGAVELFERSQRLHSGS